MMIRRVLKCVGVRAFFGICALAFASGVFAQEADTAYVPFVVNVGATVKAERDGNVISMNVTANTADTLKIPLEGSTSIMQRPQNARNNAPVITNNQRGRVSIDLPGQSYRAAEISLYAINGRRILRTGANASDASKSISRPNLVAGVYLLSVKGANGQSISSRLTHSGGNLNISVSFGSENLLTASPVAALSRQASVDDPEGWEITVSAAGYVDSSYVLDVVQGMNDVQDITLTAVSGGDDCEVGHGHFNDDVTYGCFTDERDGKSYRTVVIDGKAWMAENLNFATSSGSWCYLDAPDSCAKYGRLYDWAAVMAGASSSSANPSGVQGVCPSGWHVPSDAEWDALMTAVGGSNTAGTKLKSQTGWSSGGNGTDDFGFSALPGGYRWSGYFDNAGNGGRWWSATENDATNARRRGMNWGIAIVYTTWDSKTYGLSVRCLED